MATAAALLGSFHLQSHRKASPLVVLVVFVTPVCCWHLQRLLAISRYRSALELLYCGCSYFPRICKATRHSLVGLVVCACVCVPCVLLAHPSVDIAAARSCGTVATAAASSAAALLCPGALLCRPVQRPAAAMQLRLGWRQAAVKQPRTQPSANCYNSAVLVMHNAPTTEPTFHVQRVCVEDDWQRLFFAFVGLRQRMPHAVVAAVLPTPARLHAIV